MQSGASLGNLMLLALPLLLLLYVFWGQRRRARDLATLQESLSVGDHVLTSSGIHARIMTLEGQVADLEVAPGVTMRFDRRAIMSRVDTDASATGESAVEEN